MNRRYASETDWATIATDETWRRPQYSKRRTRLHHEYDYLSITAITSLLSGNAKKMDYVEVRLFFHLI